VANQNFRVKNGLEVGTGATLSSTGTLTVTNLTVTGITTLNVLSSVSATGAASTQNVRTDSLVVSGVSTFAGITSVTGATLFVNQANASGVITAASFVKNGATPTNFLKAGGSDSALLSSDVTGALGYTPANAAAVSGQYPIGNSIILDNFSSSFNGSDTDFTLATAGIAFTPTGSSANLVVSVGGIIQKPGTDYSIVQVGGGNTNTIRFTTAPTSGLDCFVVGLGGQGALLSDISWNAKGDLVVATGDNVASILNVGSNNSILIADSSAASGVKWGSSINTLTFTDSVTVGTGVTILPSGIPAGKLIGALPAIDGSALTGVVAAGTGVIVRDSGTLVGTAATIDFGDNLTVSTISAGIVTVTATAATSTFNNLNVTGVSTLGNTIVGGATTQLIVNGNTRITGILTIGTGSITLDGSSNSLSVGTGVTLHHTNGVQVGGNNLHSTVLTVNNINSSGISTFGNTVVGGATTQLVVNGNARITGILTIGTSSLTLDGNNNQIIIGSGVTIRETGSASFNEGVKITGIVTASSFSGSASGLTGIPAGQLTGALPAIDGSALFNVIGSGSGVIVKDSGTPVGTAGTIDFGDNLTVSTISAGIVTVSSSGGGSFVTSAAGIHTLSNIGIGTTNPRFTLEVGAVGAAGTTLFVNGETRILGTLSVGDGTIIIHRESNQIRFKSTGIIAVVTHVGTGFTNLRIGDTDTGSSFTSGSNNTFIGAAAGKSTSTGSCNNFLGRCAGRYHTTGTNNNFLGFEAGRGQSAATPNTGCYNNFFGADTGRCNTTGTSNNFFGVNAGRCNTTGSYNNFFGQGAGRANTCGSLNNFLGLNAGCSNTTGCYNNFLGLHAGCTNTCGCHNNFLGQEAGRDNTTACHNNFFGRYAGRNNTTGEHNNFFGVRAGVFNTIGSFNNFLGRYSGFNNTSGSHNNFIGREAGCCNNTGCNNNFFGNCAGHFNTSGYYNNFLGFFAGFFNTTGYSNNLLGQSAGYCNTTGNHNNFFGSNAGYCNASGSCNNFLGDSAGRGNGSTGCHNNFFGAFAGYCIQTGCYNNFSGHCAGHCNDTGSHNNFFGRLAGCLNTSGVNNNFIGQCAGHYHTTGCNNNFIGIRAGRGCSAGAPVTGSDNNFFGGYAGSSNQAGSHNNFIGFRAGFCNNYGCFNNYIGCFAGRYNIHGCYNNFLGENAGHGNSDSTGSWNNFLGKSAGCKLTYGVNNNALGQCAGFFLTSGNNNNFFGICAGHCNDTGSNNTFMGGQAGFTNRSGNNNTFIGYQAGYCNCLAEHNIFLGYQAGYCNSASNACNNYFFGRCAGYHNQSGNNNTFLGAYAGFNNSSGYNNTFFGTRAGCNNTTGTCNVVIGPANVPVATNSNQVVISSGSGNAACYSGSFSSWSNTSDCRDKTNIQTLQNGRDFLAKVRPVKFQWNFRDEKKKNLPLQGQEEAGFLAQQLQEVVAEYAADYLRLVDDNSPDDLGVYKTNLIPVMVKAIQELDAENTLLKTRLEALEAHVGIATNT